VFGLMDVLNFGHGVFIALGAFVATTRDGRHGGLDTGLAQLNLAASSPRHAGGHGRGRRPGLAFERVIVRPVYGQHLKQILITMGGMIVGEEIIKVIWGPLQIALPLPEALRGAFIRRRRGDREVPRRWPSLIGLVVFVALAVDAGAHQGRPADPRRRAGPRDGRAWATASAACSSACSSPARRWPAWAA
jgi:branched-chain amino acid transport system permease protein